MDGKSVGMALTYPLALTELAIYITIPYQEVEEEYTHEDTKCDPYAIGEDRVGNMVHFSLIIGKPEYRYVRTPNCK